jgi:outer membrane immunogenic protein
MQLIPGGGPMKKLLLASTALVFGGQAFAADIPIKAPRIAAPVAYSWTSCYVGGHVGGGWNRTAFSEPDNFVDTIPIGGSVGANGRGGALGGAQVGCDYQFASNWVFGVAGDFSWANIQGSAVDPFFAGKSGGPITFSSKTDRLASATGRIGYAWDRVLLYGKGGVGWAHDQYAITNAAFFAGAFCGGTGFFGSGPCNAAGSTTRIGWVAGAGIEWAFANNWSTFIEYDRYGFGTKNVTLVAPASIGPAAYGVKQNIDVVKVGLNYRFGAFGP